MHVKLASFQAWLGCFSIKYPVALCYKELYLVRISKAKVYISRKRAKEQKRRRQASLSIVAAARQLYLIIFNGFQLTTKVQLRITSKCSHLSNITYKCVALLPSLNQLPPLSLTKRRSIFSTTFNTNLSKTQPLIKCFKIWKRKAATTKTTKTFSYCYCGSTWR